MTYDPRRPRIPDALAARIDEARGQTSFNAWCVAALERALGQGAKDGGSSGPTAKPDRSAPARAPRGSASPSLERFGS